MITECVIKDVSDNRMHAATLRHGAEGGTPGGKGGGVQSVTGRSGEPQEGVLMLILVLYW